MTQQSERKLESKKYSKGPNDEAVVLDVRSELAEPLPVACSGKRNRRALYHQPLISLHKISDEPQVDKEV